MFCLLALSNAFWSYVGHTFGLVANWQCQEVGTVLVNLFDLAASRASKNAALVVPQLAVVLYFHCKRVEI